MPAKPPEHPVIAFTGELAAQLREAGAATEPFRPDPVLLKGATKRMRTLIGDAAKQIDTERVQRQRTAQAIADLADDAGPAMRSDFDRLAAIVAAQALGDR